MVYGICPLGGNVGTYLAPGEAVKYSRALPTKKRTDTGENLAPSARGQA